MSTEPDLSRLTDEEVTRLMKMLNNKQLYKDPSSTTADSISNCLSIQPFKTLSSYNNWIQKNLILISETDECIYVSGCNVIIEKIKTKVQEIIPLAHKCYVTSLTYVKTTSNERIIFVGEKLFPDENKIISGGFEIFHLENRNKKLALDLSAYVEYNCYVYDIIAGNNNETCVIILKNLNNNLNEVKLFFYNYITFSLIDIEDIKFNLTSICINPTRENQYLLYAPNYCGIWDFHNSKVQLILYNEFYNDNRNDILCATFLRAEEREGVALSFKNEWIEIYIRNTEEEQISGIKYILFFRFDILSFFINKNLNNLNLSNGEQDSANGEAFLDNYIQPETEDYISPNVDVNKMSVNSSDNFAKFIICRKNLVLLFLNKTQLVISFEITEENSEPKIKVNYIDLLAHKILENCHIDINDELTKMVMINGELDEKYGMKQSGDMMTSGDKKNENIFTLNEISLNYYKYKINDKDGIPYFEFENKLLENRALGYPVKFLVTSNSPRIVLVNNGFENQDLFLYRQKLFSNLNNYLKQKNFESSSQSHVQYKHDYYQENCSFEEFYHKKLDDKPLSICFSPQGKAFFISYKDCGYLYTILEREIKEVFKIAMYCRSCTFDETGTYLAFGTSEFDNEYNINILNLACYEYDYMITKVPQPTKLIFVDGGRSLIAQFNDNSTNILGWSLNWEHRLIENFTLSQKDKSERDEKNSQIILKISDFSGNIVDFGYDHSLGMCIITSHDKRQRVYWAIKDEKHWEFNSDLVYSKLLIIKKYDSIIFGTSEGTLRACIWPIQNMLKDMMIDHPEYIETKVHNARITSLCVSEDLEFLYTSAEDGSIFVSSISALSNDVPLELKNFYYFDINNVLPKKIFFTADEIIYITDNIYQNKVDALKKKKSAIQGMISEFQSRKEKINQNNATDLENQRTKLTEMLDQKIREVKEKENEKEKETKKLKDEREQQFKKLKEDLFDMKKKFKTKKEKKQNETTKLINCIKFAKEKFEQKKLEIENLRKKTNNNITACLENIHTILKDKKNEIDKMVRDRTKKFEVECEKNENLYETEIRQKEAKFKQSLEEFEEQKKETDNEIMKKNKDNKNYDEKINEWENHLKELKVNNEELMETYIFNTLKLNQMNQLLTDNENKISIKEKIVKEKRLVNDRLEQLRFVLEYQIKNLILEKTPIEEQIKNFESLHSDFYKRFNLLYTELLNIGELIENNQKCIDTYRDELSETKKSLYRLKNLYKSIDVALNSILKNKLDTKKDIIDQIFQVYQTYLYTFNDNKKQTKYISTEMKLQTQNIEKEIYNQKNNVLKELIDKRAERRRIIIEKEEMMKDIRLDNQLLIQECSNIRENLEDILKNINDIEKKFIELTNNNTFLSNKSNQAQVQDIQGRIKIAKNKVLLNDEDKIRVGKMNKNDKLPPIKKKNLIPITGGEDIDILNAEELLKKQKMNTEELMKQQRELEAMQKRYKEFVGEQQIDERRTQGNITDNMAKKIESGRIITIKSNKYYDVKEGDIKK
jgi:hypothetical protein